MPADFQAFFAGTNIVKLTFVSWQGLMFLRMCVVCSQATSEI